MALRLDDVDLHRDRALVERFQAGDPAAFDELYRRYFQRLRRYCEKRVGDRYEAEEVAQEAFARALRAMPQFAGDRRFYPWVTVIASRLCVDSHRRRARTTPEADIDLGLVEGGQDDIVDAVDTDLLRQALERLGPRHREVLHLRESEGWSYQHIAEHYGVTMGTVEALLFRARKALKREFLAIAPRDGGFLAGVPLLGWLLRKAGSARARMESWNAGTIVPIAANVSAAVVIGSAAVLVPSHHSGSTGDTHVITASPGAEAPGPHPALPAPPAAAPLEPAAATPATSAPPATTSVTTNAGQPGNGNSGSRYVEIPQPASVGPSSQSSDYASSAPVAHNGDHVVLGIDPTGLATSTADRANGWVTQVNTVTGGKR